MKVYAFDVDETLEVAGGPVTLFSVMKLKSEGHILGMCGNWAAMTNGVFPRFWAGWCSFLGPMSMTKEEFLTQLKTYIPCEEVVTVGNILGVSGASDDQGAAERAGVRFIKESDFANGVR